jgi:SulP family sulfate permease
MSNLNCHKGVQGVKFANFVPSKNPLRATMPYKSSSKPDPKGGISRSGEKITSLDLRTDLPAGLVVGLLEIFLPISYAVLIFGGELSPFAGTGIGLFLIAGFIQMLIISGFTSLPGTVGASQGIPAALLTVTAVALTAQMPEGSSPTALFMTVVTAVALTALATGAAYFALGQFKLGGLVRFLPYPVIGGFVAGSGWVLATGAANMMINQTVGWEAIMPAVFIKWLPGLVWAALLLYLRKRIKSPLLVPGMLMGGLLLFYLFITVGPYSVSQAREGGWLVGPFVGSAANVLPTLADFDFAAIHWPTLFGQWVNMSTVVAMSVIALLLNGTGLELAANRDLDINHELRVAGVANLVSGLFGGMVGYQQLSVSTMNYRMQSFSRLSGLIAAFAVLLPLFFGSVLLAVMPRVVLGGLLMYLGLSFLWEWVVEAYWRIPRIDYVIVFSILLVTVFVGFLQAVGVGLAMAVVMFVINYSRIDVVRTELSGKMVRSRVSRTAPQEAYLQKHGGRIRIMQLQGFIFFGTAENLLKKVRERLDDATGERIEMVLLDFRRVSAIDSTAGLSFQKLYKLARSRGATLLFTDISAQILDQLQRNGLDRGTAVPLFPSQDHGLAWCEEELLREMVGETAVVEKFPDQLRRLLPDREDVHKLIPYFERLELPAGYYLIQQGEPPSDMYFIESGQVTAQLEAPDKPVVRLQTMRGGHVVGEIGFYLGQERTAAVVTDEPSVVYRFTASHMRNLQIENPELASLFHELIIRLLATRVVHLVNVVNADQD